MMLNILDTAEKKKVLKEYRLRLATMSALAFDVVVLASLLLLLPSYLLAVSKFNNAQNEARAFEIKNGDSTQEKAIAARIRAINEEVAVLSNTDTSKKIPSPATIIEGVLKIKTRDIKIIGFTYDATGSQQRIVIAGVAANRDELANFVDKLKKDSTYSNVILPISSYVKNSNIDFSIILEVKSNTDTAVKPQK